MKKSTALSLLLFIGVVLLLTTCQAKKVGTSALPQELQATLVPSVPMDAYIFARQEPDTRIAGSISSLSRDVVVHSAQAWLTPSGGQEVAGVRLSFSSQQEAQAVSDAITSNDTRLWKKTVGSSLFLVYGESDASKNLTAAIEGNKFSKLESNSPEGWALLQDLPSSPPGKVVATGFAILSDTMLAYLKANMEAGTWSQIEPIISQVKIDKVAIAAYLNKPIDPAQIKTVDDLKAHNVAVMVTGKSGYPGFLLSLGMNFVGPRMGLKEESVSGGSALSRSFVIPNVLEASGIPMHILLGAAGSQVYATGALDSSLSKKLLESALAQ